MNSNILDRQIITPLLESTKIYKSRCRNICMTNQKYKAEQLAKQLNRYVDQTSDGVWAIPSSSGGRYKVESKDNEYSCDCKGFEYTENCYHIMAVKMVMKEMVA